MNYYNISKINETGVAVHKTGFEKQILWQLPLLMVDG